MTSDCIKKPNSLKRKGKLTIAIRCIRCPFGVTVYIRLNRSINAVVAQV